jgi:hypothetical protein
MALSIVRIRTWQFPSFKRRLRTEFKYLRPLYESAANLTKSSKISSLDVMCRKER